MAFLDYDVSLEVSTCCAVAYVHDTIMRSELPGIPVHPRSMLIAFPQHIAVEAPVKVI